jgi:FAD/FMN-containing dehydrogenase
MRDNSRVRTVEPGVIERLKSLVGQRGYLDQASDIAPYCVAWRDSWQGSVPLVLRPASTAEVVEIIKICAETRTPIVPQGGNTGLTGAGQPHGDNSEIIVSTSRMNKVRDLDPLNDSITVEAGVVLADIQRRAAEADRLFPLSLGAEGSCQIGGNLSTNAGGTQVLRYGNVRSLVLGLEVVLPDGRVWNGLKALRKDNTGYDLKQLFVGAEGTLGIITAAVLKLFPRPTAIETAWLTVPSPAHALGLLALARSRLGDALSAFELMQRSIVDFVQETIPGSENPVPTASPWYVLMEVSGQGEPDTFADPLAGTLAAAFEQELVTDGTVAQSLSQRQRFWKFREDISEAQKIIGNGVKHDVSVAVSSVPEFIARADEALELLYPGIRHCSFGHMGDGNIHYNPVGPANWAGDFQAERERVNLVVHDIVADMKGSISAEHGIGQLRLTESERYKSPTELDLMRTIKRALDPENLMNPGKLVRVPSTSGGIYRNSVA